MKIMFVIIIVLSISLTVLKSLAIYKAIKKDYSSVFITMFRGFNVSALLKEKEIKTDKVKNLIIINSVIDLFYIVAVVVYFSFSLNVIAGGTFLEGNFVVLVWPIIGFKVANDFITDWQIKKAVRQSSSEKKVT